MCISTFSRRVGSSLLLILTGLLLFGCEWAMGPLPVRTNPIDMQAPVAYFRASPQASMEETLLSWRWGEGRNPGEVTILRKESSAPGSLDDPDAVIVYRSEGEAESYIDDFDDPVSGSPVLTNSRFYYSLFYDDGERVHALSASQAVFESHSVVLTQIGGLTFSFDGTNYFMGTEAAVENAAVIPPERYGLIYVAFAGIPAFNIGLVSADLQFSTVPTGSDLRLNRLTAPLLDGLSFEEYFDIVKNQYFSGGEEVNILNAGDPQNADITAIFQHWLDTLENYGLRVEATTPVGYTVLESFTVTVTYIGPSP